MRPEEVMPYIANNRDGLEEYLYFIKREDLIPYIDRIYVSETSAALWAAKHDPSQLRFIPRDYIYENYDQELAKKFNIHMNEPDATTLMNLRAQGKHTLIENIVLKLENDYEFTEIPQMYGGTEIIDKLERIGENIDWVVANRPEIYNQYSHLLTTELEEEVIFDLITHGYPEVAEQVINTADDLHIETCASRSWGQLEMMKVLLNKYQGGRIIELSIYKYLQLDTVKYLFDEGYELLVDVEEMLFHSPKILKFMIENYRLLNYQLPDTRFDIPPNQHIEALEVVKLLT